MKPQFQNKTEEVLVCGITNTTFNAHGAPPQSMRIFFPKKDFYEGTNFLSEKFMGRLF